MDEFMALIKTIVVLALVIFLANILLKQLNRHMTGKNRYIKVLEGWQSIRILILGL